MCTRIQWNFKETVSENISWSRGLHCCRRIEFRTWTNHQATTIAAETTAPQRKNMFGWVRKNNGFTCTKFAYKIVSLLILASKQLVAILFGMFGHIVQNEWERWTMNKILDRAHSYINDVFSCFGNPQLPDTEFTQRKAAQSTRLCKKELVVPIWMKSDVPVNVRSL